MTQDAKIKYMITSLRIAMEEIAYKEKYDKLDCKEKRSMRKPNISIIRDNLKNVGRQSFIAARNITKEPQAIVNNDTTEK